MSSTTDNDKLRQLDDLMARLARTMQKQMVTVSSCGMTATQVFILRYLDKHDLAKASEIAKAVGLSPGAVTQVCDELVKHRLIDRTRSEVDRRVVHIGLSQGGKDILEQIRSSRTERLYEIVRLLGQPDADEFVRLIGRVVEIIEDMQENANNGM